MWFYLPQFITWKSPLNQIDCHNIVNILKTTDYYGKNGVFIDRNTMKTYLPSLTVVP